MAGKFITLEGLDGCGKSTQLRRLEQWLARRAQPFVTTCEPGGTDIGRLIRPVLLDARHSAIVPMTELLLYAADRAQHVEEFVRPALARGQLVISDRYTDATLAFQGYGRGFDRELCHQLNQLATGGLKPDLTLLFDLEVDLALQRISDREQSAAQAQTETYQDRFHEERREFHQRVRDGYLAIAAREPDRVKIINAAAEVDTVWQTTQQVVARLLDELDES